MTKPVVASLAAIWVLFVFSSCTHRLNVGLNPDYEEGITRNNLLSSVEPEVEFGRGRFVDQRSDTTKLLSFRQQMHTFNLFAGRPIDDAVYDGLETLVSISGHKWKESEPAEVRVDFQLLNIQAYRAAGFSTVDASSSVQIKVDFVNAETNENIYMNVYNGTDERSRAMIGTMSMVEQSIDASFLDCINKIGADEGLISALNRFIKESGK